MSVAAVSFLLAALSVWLGIVDSASVTSSSLVDRSFACSNGRQIPSICPSKDDNATKTLYIQGFVPATNKVFESETIIPAAYMAIDDVNANCSLLSGYKLQLDFVNTLCDPSEATWQLIDSIVLQQEDGTDPQTKITFLGGGCSLATEPVAALSGRFYKIPHISYGASSPSLSQQNLFPNFIRTIPSEIQANKARFALMRHFNWSRVATLHETQTIFSLAVEDFNSRYDVIYNKTNSGSSGSDENDEDHVLRSFTDDPQIPLTQIMQKDIRIIFGYFYEDKATDTLCLARHMGLTTKNHLWMFPAWFTRNWWNTTVEVDANMTCTPEEMREAVTNSFFLDSHLYGFDKSEVTDTGTRTANEFDDKYDCYLEEFRANEVTLAQNLTDATALPHIYRTFSYDAVWTNALALDKTARELERLRGEGYSNMTLEDFQYFMDGENSTSTLISEYMRTTSFKGVSGDVSFDVNGTRMGLNAIYQLVDNATTGNLELVLVAIHDPGNSDPNSLDGFNFSFEFIVDPKFKGGSAPRDRRTPKNIYMNSSLVHVCQTLTTLAILVGVALLIFNLVTLFKPLIRDSAPHINTIILIGCIWILVTCYLLSVDTANPAIDDKVGVEGYTEDDETNDEVSNVRNHRYKIICILRLWFLTIGFTLSFGALFAKTWQVYRVYTNPKLLKQPFKMWNFLIIMGIFLAIDIVYLIFWTAAYPFRRNLRTSTDDAKDVENIHEECQCDNYPYLIGALYVYKGLLVVFGLFLAYESRNVKYHQINDSRFISISMYIVVILVGIGAPLSLVLAVHFFTDAAYGLAIFMVIASALSCMLIIFVPKFVYMARGKDTMVRENDREEITVSDGLQLGRTTIDQTEVNTVETEVDQLKQENAKKDLQLRQLQDEVIPEEAVGEGIKPHTGSDGDSGVLVTVDENDVFSSETTTNGGHRSTVNTPSSSESAPSQRPSVAEA